MQLIGREWNFDDCDVDCRLSTNKNRSSTPPFPRREKKCGNWTFHPSHLNITDSKFTQPRDHLRSAVSLLTTPEFRFLKSIKFLTFYNIFFSETNKLKMNSFRTKSAYTFSNVIFEIFQYASRKKNRKKIERKIFTQQNRRNILTHAFKFVR